MLKLFCIQIEKRDVLQSEKASLQTERIFSPAKKENLNVFQPSIYPVDFGYMVGPASGITIPEEQFFEDILNRDIDSDPVDVQHGILEEVDSDPLHDAMAVVFPFFS